MVCRSPSGRRRSGKRSRRGISVMGHDPLGSGSLLIRSPRWAGRRRPRSPTWTIQPKDTAETGQLLRESHARQRDRNHPDQPVPDQPPPTLTDRFSAAVVGPSRAEVGQELLLPGAQGPTESGDLGDRAAGERSDHRRGDLLALGETLGGERGPKLLVAAPGDGHLVVRVTGLEPLLYSLDLAGGQLLGAGRRRVATPVTRARV